MKSVALWLLSGGVWLYGLLPVALASEDAEVNLKAMFIARFAQFTQWPPPPQTVFHYCVALDHSMFKAINSLQVRSPAGEPVKLTLIRRPAEAKPCQLLVMTMSDRQQLQHWASGLASMPMLIVADNAEAFRTVATISLVSEPDGMTFRINQTAARERGLELSSQLLKLAREVR
jgi:hypothetical protein